MTTITDPAHLPPYPSKDAPTIVYICGTGEPPEDADYVYRGTYSPKGWCLCWKVVRDE